MKPYGQKKEKTRKGMHNSDNCGCEICNTVGWKVLKSRERKTVSDELNLTLPEDPKLTYDDFSEMVVVVPFENSIGENLFRAIYHPLAITCVGVTPEHAIG